MGNIKKIIVLCCAVLMTFIFVSCDIKNVDNRQTLTTPSNLHINETILYWDAVENALSYKLQINDEYKSSETNWFCLDDLEYCSYSIKISALNGKDYKNSDCSEEISFDKFPTLQDLTITDDYSLEWSNYAGVIGYVISIFDADNNFIKDLNIIQDNNLSMQSISLADLDAGNYKLQVKPYGNSNNNLSLNTSIDFHKSIFQSVSQKSNNSSSNLYIRIDFKLNEDFSFNYYNFTSATDAEMLMEYAETYDNFFNGTQEEKESAVSKIGNDVILNYYYYSNGTKVSLANKTKSWDGYLNKYKDTSEPPSDLENITGYYFDLTLDSDYYYRTVYNKSNIGSVISGLTDRNIYIDIIIIKNGVVYTKTLVSAIPG